jgi:hypothetical protein
VRSAVFAPFVPVIPLKMTYCLMDWDRRVPAHGAGPAMTMGRPPEPFL